MTDYQYHTSFVSYLIHPHIHYTTYEIGFFGGMMEGLINMFNPSADQYAARMLPLFTAPELSAHKGTSFGQKGTGMSFSVCLSHFLVVSVRFCFAITARLLVLPYCCDPSQSFKLHLTYFTLFLFFLLSFITVQRFCLQKNSLRIVHLLRNGWQRLMLWRRKLCQHQVRSTSNQL